MGLVSMRLPDGTIIMHGKRPYDPAKAHEYYLRTRKLKGRKKGSSTYTVRYPGGQTVKLTGRQLAEQKAYVAQRIGHIKAKLAELNTKLTKMRSEARKKDAEAKRDSKKAPTAAEKSEVARESKKYREKHKQELANKAKGSSGSKGSTKKSGSSMSNEEALEQRIGEIRDRLTVAVEKQRALASATRGK